MAFWLCESVTFTGLETKLFLNGRTTYSFNPSTLGMPLNFTPKGKVKNELLNLSLINIEQKSDG